MRHNCSSVYTSKENISTGYDENIGLKKHHVVRCDESSAARHLR